MENVLFKGAIELQAGLDKRTATASKAKQELDDAAYVQMVLFIAGNQSEKIKAGTRKGRTIPVAID